MKFSHWMKTRRRLALGLAVLSAATGAATASTVATASAAPLPGFHDGYADNNGVRIHYVIGGHGPALILLHGWPETWRAWSGVAPDLARDHTVVALDLRGLGDSEPAPTDDGGYTALTLASDVHSVVNHLRLNHVDIAGHDWGGQVALAYAARYRPEVDRLAIMEAPPAVDYLDFVQTHSDYVWWDAFVIGSRGDTAEQLVKGREHGFYNAIYHNSAQGGSISRESEDRYIWAYSKPGSTHAGFEYFRQQDAGENAVDILIKQDGKLTVPVLGVGGQYSMGAAVGSLLPHVAANVTTAVVPGANHWVMEENSAFVIGLFRTFFKA